jgi:hypothetical protein
MNISIDKPVLTIASAMCLFTIVISPINRSPREQGGIAHEEDCMKIVFLHHSTGERIWNAGVPQWFEKYNSQNDTAFEIEERIFPSRTPYGWNNYPYDYWNIWVDHTGNVPFMGEPTLEILAKQYDLIIFKHCFPVSNILPDTGTPDIRSQDKRLENYILQYEALKEKMREFPETEFLLWTGPPVVECTSLRYRIGSFLKRRDILREQAERARDFHDWIKNVWDEPGDNIHIWDYYSLSTEGELYLKSEYAESDSDSHPNRLFSERAAPELCRRIVDVLEGKGGSSPK